MTKRLPATDGALTLISREEIKHNMEAREKELWPGCIEIKQTKKVPRRILWKKNKKS